MTTKTIHMTTKTIHMSLSVRGALRRSNDELHGWLEDGNGRTMTGQQAREALMDELAKGHECIPVCDPKACPDFDYSGGGCPGHVIEEAEEATPC